MRKVHEKSIILGIGIGMIITAISGLIFASGSQKELSKTEIITLAKGYGLIEKPDILLGGSINTSNEGKNPSYDSSAANSSAEDLK